MSINLQPNEIEEIRTAYYDPKIGYGSAQKLRKKLDNKYTIKQIKSVLESDQLYESTRKVNEDFITDKQLKINGDFGDWQSDLMFFPAKYKKFNHGYSTIICFISLTTRRAYAYPVKSKKTNDMIVALEYFISDLHNKTPKFDFPKNITVDAGMEYSRGVYEFLSKYDINLYTVNKSQSNSHATAVVERFNRTLRELIEQHFKATNSNNFIDALSELCANYNTSPHRTIGKSPEEYTEEDAENRINENKKHNDEIYKTVYHDFNVGDNVRVISKKKAFDKGNKYKISDKIYTIESIDGNRFRLKNNKGKISKKERFVYELAKSNVNNNVDIKSKDEIKTEDKKIKHQRKLKREGLDLNREQIDVIMTN